MAVWMSKGRRVIHMEMEKQMFGKQMFFGSSLIMGHRKVFDQRSLAGFLPVTPSSY